MTWRELGVYVRGLPPTSRLRTALAGGQPSWTAAEYMLASIWDVLAAANWQRAASGAKNPPPRPKPHPRPGDDRPGAERPERTAARQGAIARARERERAVAAGEIT